MRTPFHVLVHVLAALGGATTVACSATTEPPEKAPAVALVDTDDADEAGQAEAPEAPVRTGVVAPAQPVTVTLWPEAYSGELLVRDVLAPGTVVEEGDVIAWLDARDLEEQIVSAELELNSARVQHEGLIEKNAIAAEAAASKLMRVRADLDRARRSYAGFTTIEAAFKERSDQLVRKGEQSRIDDQKDELGQLEAMYEADELTDATEEIVLKRSRRNLALTEERNELSEDQRRYRTELADELEAEKRAEDIVRREEELAHLIRTQAVDARGREDAEARSTAGLQKKAQSFERLMVDLGRMEVVAPSSGVLLHGSSRDYRPGGSGRLVERGDRLQARAESFLIADPGSIAIAIDVPESELAAFPDGASVVVQPLSAPEDELSGELSVSAYPTSIAGGEGQFAGLVRLDGTPGSEAPGLVFGTHVRVERSDTP